uniref:Glycosyltransferase family 92 protein n=1 Tax=Rhabditophanes sp. KR3021 TaxID=114890 RepID=A0AC35U2U9_9BILA
MFYIRSAYRVSDEEIRINFARHLKNTHTLYLLENGEQKKFSVECGTNECPSIWTPKFTILPWIGRVQHKIGNDTNEEITIFSSRTNAKQILPVVDIRKPNNFTDYKDKLGVCIQPAYNYYKYFELIQFFETWIQNGATKFYFYKTLISKDIQLVLDHYKKNVEGVKIEIIEWSPLPKNGTYDPNRHAKRFLANPAMLDCLYRARYHQKYIAQTDLDEIIAINNKKHGTLIKFLEKVSENNKNQISTFSFLARNAKLDRKWKSFDDIMRIKFNNFENAKISAKFKRGIFSKLIFRPDYIYNFFAHHHLDTETGKLTNIKYQGYNVSITDGALHHFRERSKKQRVLHPTNHYKYMINSLNHNLIHHISNISRLNETKYLQIKKGADAFSRCMDYMNFSNTVNKCGGKFSVIRNKNFLSVNNTWISL